MKDNTRRVTVKAKVNGEIYSMGYDVSKELSPEAFNQWATEDFRRMAVRIGIREPIKIELLKS